MGDATAESGSRFACAQRMSGIVTAMTGLGLRAERQHAAHPRVLLEGACVPQPDEHIGPEAAHVEFSIAQVDELVRYGATINTFILGDDPGLARFVDALYSASRWRSSLPTSGGWGSMSWRTT